MALQFAKGTAKNGRFRFISIRNGISRNALTNNTVFVTGIKNFGFNKQDDGFIEIAGSLVFKDGSKGNIEFKLFFDKAIESSEGQAGEMTVPAAFINNSKVFLYKELKGC
jgi:hypothetical protein